MDKFIKLSFSLTLAIFLIPILNTTVYGQKSLDGEETNQPKKTDSKKPVGKGFDDSSEATPSKPKGKGLDDESVIIKKDDRVEVKPKTETFIRVGPTAEKVTPPPRKEKDRKVEKTPEPAKPAVQETDLGSELPEMVNVPAGIFMMGSLGGQENESPVHEVNLSSFEISKHEITNHQFRTFVKASKYKTTAETDLSQQTWNSYAIAGRARYPVVYITYTDAMAYCKWLSEKTKQTYRLPTEAEWEYAARGGTKNQIYPWGDKIEVSQANYASDDSRKAYGEPILDYLKPVGSYAPNGFGLFDVIGNVAEWCLDGFKADFYKESPKENPICPDQGSARVVRGGGWMNTPSFFSVSFRKNHPGAYKSSSLGFRVVRVENPPNKNVASSNLTSPPSTTNTKEPSSNSQTQNQGKTNIH